MIKVTSRLNLSNKFLLPRDSNGIQLLLLVENSLPLPVDPESGRKKAALVSKVGIKHRKGKSLGKSWKKYNVFELLPVVRQELNEYVGTRTYVANKPRRASGCCRPLCRLLNSPVHKGEEGRNGWKRKTRGTGSFSTTSR